ncbi:hypothetical protein EB796_016288 [Bugula neritina]|uniref:Uncharacterized protein n=1 Tax=Bugula neritina TaxID=10212 RepID=A0A7J7JH76_BUGNE|nr:hypothetical protein EB796_016288 [Bugula neritina]
MVLVNIVKGIFMLMFCLGYSLALLGAAKLLESLVHRLETSQVGRKLSFNSWKKMLDSDSENVFSPTHEFGWSKRFSNLQMAERVEGSRVKPSLC